MVDRNVLMARVTRIRESVARSVRLAALSEREFRADSDACALAERHLQVAIQGPGRVTGRSRAPSGAPHIADLRSAATSHS